MSRPRCIALIAHDEKKDDMAAFAAHYEKVLSQARIVATGTTVIQIVTNGPSELNGPSGRIVATVATATTAARASVAR